MFASKCKDFWGNSKFLRVIKKFLVLERNTFAFSHKSITCPRETLQTLAKLLCFSAKVLHSPKELSLAKMFREGTQSFLGECNTLTSERKCFVIFGAMQNF